MLDEEGLIAAHCLSMKDDDNTYRITAALPFAAMKLLETGAYDVKMTMRYLCLSIFRTKVINNYRKTYEYESS